MTHAGVENLVFATSSIDTNLLTLQLLPLDRKQKFIRTATTINDDKYQDYKELSRRQKEPSEI